MEFGDTPDDDHVVYSKETVSGGICTLFFVMILAVVTVINMKDMLNESSYESINGSLQRTEQKVNTESIELGKENSSVNFAVGIANKSFDFFDNDYIEPIAYKFTPPGDTLSISEDYELRRCSEEEILKIVYKEAAVPWYPNSLCFKDRSKVGIRGNWYSKEASYPIFSMAECNNATRNGRCKSPDEIRDFLEDNALYFIAQKTDYAADIFSTAEPEVIKNTLKDENG